MRRIRPAIVVVGSLLALVAALTAVVWSQGDFLRESAANYLRERLAADFGAQFQTRDLRGRWFPPGLSLGQVTLHRSGEPWVLTAEDVRLSINPYAVIFGRERLGRVVLERPRLFVRANYGTASETASPASAPVPGSTPSPARSPGQGGAGAVTGVAERLRAVLQPPFPLRVLEILDGRVEVIDRSGGRAVATGINLAAHVSSGGARVLLKAKGLLLDRPGRRAELGRIDADVTFEAGLARIGHLIAAGGPVTGKLQGTVEYGGALALKGDLSAHLEGVVALVGHPGALGGTGTIAGEITGSWRDPAAAGSLVVEDLAVGGRRWPQARGQIGWAAGRLSWSKLRLPLGEGAVTTAGQAEFSGGALRYRIDAEAQALDLAQLPAAPAEIAARVLGLDGTLHWEGSGTGAEAAGSGRLTARFAIAPRSDEQVTLEAAAQLERGRVTIQDFRGATRLLEVAGAGSWSPKAGFSGRINGTAGDIEPLFRTQKIALGGRASFSGDLVVDARGPRFTGEAQLSKGRVAALQGVEGSARLVATPESVRIVEGAVVWPGGRGGVNGTIEIPSGRLDLGLLFRQVSLPDAARLLGTDAALAGGALEARLRLQGTAGSPEIEGQVSGNALHYRGVAVDKASLSLTYTARRLGITRLQLQRGATQLLFRGELREGGVLAGEFESPAFNSADFFALAGLELAGSLRGRVSGSVENPSVKGTVRASRLRYAGFDLRGAELEVDYRGGVAGVEGWIAAAENRLRLVVEPARDWRFESDLEVRQLESELVRSGFSAFLPALARTLGKTSFLAAGQLRARGRLRDPGSVRADLRLDALWLQAGGKTLQNTAPVRVSWRDGGLAVEDFRIAGDQYHLEVRGGGRLAEGWNLQAEGSVNLGIFREYWPEIEEVEGLGELRLTVGGPWSAPQPEGILSVREAFMRLRLLPELIEHLGGRLELRGKTLTVVDLSGTIGGKSFRGGGSYQLAQDRLDAQVEGRLDLALFRGSIPVARELRGPIQTRLRLTGALAAPVLSGEIEILDAELFARPFPAKITHLRGKVLVEAERLEIQELTGQTGGGTARLTGVMDWRRSPVRVDAELEGKGILISLAGALKAQSDLRLGLHGNFQDLKLAGEVHILKARYLREFGESPPALAPAAGPAAESSAAGPDLSRMALDVKLVAADNVWIANRTAKIETAVALEIGGRLGAPVVRGEINAIQGEAYYLSRQFRLESGSLRFAPPATVPLLDLQASTSVGETQILFLMDGPLNKLSYHLTSLPAMSQQDLISLLTIGETRSGLERQGERASTAGAAVFTSEPLVNALGDEARSAMGLEVLQLEPVVGLDNQVSARVTLGTHLSDRLFVSYSQNLGATEDQQVAVQYSMLDYLSIWGQELRQGIYSLDLVFRYAFK